MRRRARVLRARCESVRAETERAGGTERERTREMRFDCSLLWVGAMNRCFIEEVCLGFSYSADILFLLLIIRKVVSL